MLSVTGTILILVLKLHHSPHLSSWYIVFLIMKVKSDSVGKGRDKKNNKSPNSLSFLNTNRLVHTHWFLEVNNETEKEKWHFPLKIPAVRYLDWFTFYVISMAQSGSENFKCVCYGREESCDPKQSKLCSKLHTMKTELNKSLKIVSLG